MSESFPRSEFDQPTSEYLRHRAFNNTVTELLFNSMDRVSSNWTVHQPSQEAGRLNAELFPIVCDEGADWHGIGISVHEAGSQDPFLGEHQITIQLVQRLIEPDGEELSPPLEYIKQYDVYYKDKRFMVQKSHSLMYNVDNDMRDLDDHQLVELEEVSELNKIIYASFDIPSDI